MAEFIEQLFRDGNKIYPVTTPKAVRDSQGRTWEDLLNAKYTKPSGGIPSTDLSREVQQTLSRVDEIYQDYIDANNLI